jgi:hypothetical protein
VVDRPVVSSEFCDEVTPKDQSVAEVERILANSSGETVGRFFIPTDLRMVDWKPAAVFVPIGKMKVVDGYDERMGVSDLVHEFF